MPTGFEEWGGYMEAKKQKLNEQFALHSSECSTSISKIFSGISIFVNGFTVPSAEDLKSLMGQHGGVYHTYYSKQKTTHIVATNLPHFKIKQLKDEKVVRPDWITDSISKGKLLPCSEYQLYTASFKQGQTTLNFSKDSKEGNCHVSSCGSNTDAERSFSPYGDLNDFNESAATNSNVPLSHIIIPQDETANEAFMCTLSKSSLASNNTSSNEAGLVVKRGNEVDSSKSNDSTTCSNAAGPSDVSKISSISTVRALKAGQPNFLSEYYTHSRLHHISTAAADFKDFVKLLHSANDGSYSGRDSFLKWKSDGENASSHVKHHSENQKCIMHFDMDCFFVSVALRKHPELIGKPVAVTHAKGNNVPQRPGVNAQFEISLYEKKRQMQALGVNKSKDNIRKNHPKIEDSDKTELKNEQQEFGSTSEVASCSYEARQLGVKNGMYLGEAFRRCPNLQLVPYDFEGYTEVSQTLYKLIASLTLEIEAISCDEMFIDCTDVLKATNSSPLELASFVRETIKSKTCCTASAGIGSNILLARLATREAKPNGQYFVTPDEASIFIKKQLVKNLPGVGYATQSRLKALHVITCEDLQAVALSSLQKEFGPKTGKTLFDHCRGKDDRSIEAEKERKSVSAEINYGMRFQKVEEAESFLKELAEEVEKRLKKINRKGKLITLKIKVRSKDAPAETFKFMGHGVCDNVAKSISLQLPTDSAEIFGREVVNCLKLMSIPFQDIRGMGIQVSRLAPNTNSQKTQSKTLFHFMNNMTSTSRPDKSSNQPKIDDKRNSKNTDFSTVQEGVDGSCTGKLFPQSIKGNQPGESSTTKPNDLSKEMHLQSTKEKESLPDEINFADIDKSVFDALPDDIRREIIAQYRPFVKPAPNQPTRIKLKAPKTKDSPRKKMNGIQKRLSPKKKSLLVKKSSPTKNRESRFQCSMEASITFMAAGGKVGTSKSEQPDVDQASTKPSLCGAADLNSQRKLIGEWIKTSEPIADDIDTFLCFMLTLIELHELEQLDLIIKCLYRNIRNADSDKWKSAYSAIVNEIQPVMKQNYGSILKLEMF